MEAVNQNMTKWEKMMVDYGFFHQDKMNILTHLIFVPVIVASVLIPLTFIGFLNVQLGGITLPLNLGLKLASHLVTGPKTIALYSIEIYAMCINFVITSEIDK